jgi:hypothetical protein
MSGNLEINCPLCERIVPQQELFAFDRMDGALGFHDIIEVIKAYHPDWHEEQGVCSHCWKTFSDSSRVIHSLRVQGRSNSLRGRA